jgi:hypothetical protein
VTFVLKPPPPTPPPLNQGQREAAEAFFTFLFSDEKEFGISGPGGVGKTFLMGYLIDVIMPRYQEVCALMGTDALYDSVEMAATTNKAAQALGDATQRPTGTIQALLGLKVTEDYQTGESKLTKSRSWTVHERKIIFIDECGMIDTPLDTYIQEGTHKCKLVYVGDHCQLGPVKERTSPIYKRNIRFHELTEPMRNNGQPALMGLCNQLRETVETGTFWPIRIVPGVIDWLDGPEMAAELAQVFQQQNHDDRILAYTNRQVVAYNDHLRHEVRNLPAEFTPGELLVNTQALHLPRRLLSVEEEVNIIDRCSHTEFVDIDDDARLEVRRMTIETGLGERYTDVKVPVDRPHFAALQKWLAKQKNWTKMYHLKNFYPDLRQRDAATVHKAQGSSYNTIYIDVSDISTCHIAHMAARLLYVAVSRPRHRIVFYGQLAEKYGGLIS